MIPVFRPSLSWPAVARQLQPVIESGWLGLGPKTAELEYRLADAVHARYFVATSSCTAALQLAVHCLNLPKGSRVLTTPITFISTAAALVWEGHIPVFGHVGPCDGLLRESFGAHNTVAAITVHLGGAECQLPGAEHSAVIEDCAHAYGAPWLTEQKCLMRCWSFHAVKNLPMGDGGGISTNDEAVAERLRRLRWLGISKSTHARNQGGYTTDYDIPELGWKSHMNDVTAAIGLAALDSVEAHNRRRYAIAQRYYDAFPANAATYWPLDSACHFYPLFFDDRLEVQQRLEAAGIAYSRHYKPAFLFAPFMEYPCPGKWDALDYYRRALVLPIFPSMTDEQVEQVIKAVKG